MTLCYYSLVRLPSYKNLQWMKCAGTPPCPVCFCPDLYYGTTILYLLLSYQMAFQSYLFLNPNLINHATSFHESSS